MNLLYKILLNTFIIMLNKIAKYSSENTICISSVKLQPTSTYTFNKSRPVDQFST